MYVAATYEVFYNEQIQAKSIGVFLQLFINQLYKSLDSVLSLTFFSTGLEFFKTTWESVCFSGFFLDNESKTCVPLVLPLGVFCCDDDT